jgi:hypothetical protein
MLMVCKLCLYKKCGNVTSKDEGSGERGKKTEPLRYIGRRSPEGKPREISE